MDIQSSMRCAGLERLNTKIFLLMSRGLDFKICGNLRNLRIDNNSEIPNCTKLKGK